MRDLARGPQSEPFVVVVIVGDESTAFHRDREQSLLEDSLLDHHVRLFHHVRVLRRVRQLPPDVVRSADVGGRAAFLHCLLDVHHGRQLVVLDLDELRCVSRLIPLLRQHHRHRLALIDDLVVRDRELVRNLLLLGHERVGDRQPACDVVLEICVRVHRLHAGRSLGGGEVDRADLRVRVGTPYDVHMKHPWARHVVDVATVPADEARILATMDLGADHRGDGHYSPPVAIAAFFSAGALAPPIVRAAVCTALTMFT